MSKEVSTNFIRSQIYKTSQKQIKEIGTHKDNTQPPTGRVGPRGQQLPQAGSWQPQALTRAKNVPSARRGGRRGRGQGMPERSRGPCARRRGGCGEPHQWLGRCGMAMRRWRSEDRQQRVASSAGGRARRRRRPSKARNRSRRGRRGSPRKESMTAHRGRRIEARWRRQWRLGRLQWRCGG